MGNKLAILVAIVLLTGCKGCRENNSVVPLVSVDFSVNINNASYFELTNITGWVYVTGGSRGIIIYRNNIDQFTAFDRHAPYNAEEGCRVSVLEDDITLKDECSESSWLILDGSLISGPAEQPLKQYSTNFSGSVLRVYN
tara:strand:- start:4320 stop:4739 length:420 start_codon:yes stop_codon:yes gene_type:complete